MNVKFEICAIIRRQNAPRVCQFHNSDYFVFQGFTGLGKEEEENQEPIRLGEAARAAHVVADAGAPVQPDVGTIYFFVVERS